MNYWPVAQGLERHSYKVEVVGSIPTGPTINKVG